MRRDPLVFLMASLATVTLAACGGSGGTTTDTATDSVADTASDLATDTGTDVATDEVEDSISDTGTDVATDEVEDPVSDTGTDVEPDAVPDVVDDVIFDMVSDTGTDVSADEVSDAGADAVTDSVSDADGASTPLLVINEVDYDCVGSDSAEFVEIYNAGTTTALLDGLAVITFNGFDNNEVDRFALSGTLAAGAFFLLASDGVTIPVGVGSISIPNNSIQNGEPDGLALFDIASETIIDALCYEGAMTAVTIAGVPGTFNLLEGTATTAEDSNTSVRSLIRFPDGHDTDNAIDDWSQTTTPTPGLVNVP